MQEYLNKFIKEQLEEQDNEKIQFFLTTVQKIKKIGMKKETWQEAR